MTEKMTIEELLAVWRRVQRELDETDPFTPGRAQLEMRVRELRLMYQARIEEIAGTPQAEPA